MFCDSFLYLVARVGTLLHRECYFSNFALNWANSSRNELINSRTLSIFSERQAFAPQKA